MKTLNPRFAAFCLAFLLAEAPLYAAATPDLAPASPSETISGIFQAVPRQWQEPIGLFLNSSLDAASLRRCLLARAPANFARLSAIERVEALREARPRDPLSPAYVGAIGGGFLEKAARADPRDEDAATMKYAQLDAVLGAFLPGEDRAVLTQAARRARARLSARKQAELLDAMKRVGEELAGSSPAPSSVLEGTDAPASSPRRGDAASLTADLLEIELPDITLNEGRLALDEEGLVRFDSSGFPDALTYRLARKAGELLRLDPMAESIRGADRALLERLRGSYEKTTAFLSSGGNAQAQTMLYAEPTPGGADMPLLDYVRAKRFMMPGRWIWSSQRLSAAPQGYARITAEIAKSPFVKKLGPGAYSTIYWAAKPDGEYGAPDPLGMRVRVNSAAADPDPEHTLELMAPVGRDPDGQIQWKAFFFKKIGGEWVLGSPLKLNPANRCINCHYREDAQGRRRLDPLPASLRTRQDFLAVGYENTALLEQYLSRSR